MHSTLAIDGMFCGGCAATVERALLGVPGVQSAAVSFISDAAVVEHDARVGIEDALSDRVGKLGYTARLLGDTGRQAASQTSRDRFQQQHLIRLCVAVGFGMWVMLASLVAFMGQVPAGRVSWGLALVTCLLAVPVIAYSGSGFYRMAWRSLRVRAPGMDAMISLAVLAASLISLANLWRGVPVVYVDAAVMLITFQLIARLTDFRVRRQANDAIRGLLELAPDRAWKLGAAGAAPESVLARDLAVGDHIICRPGERLAADGVVAKGRAALDASLLSGESEPVTVDCGDTVHAGTVVLDAPLTVRVTAAGGQRGIDALASEVRRLVVAKSALAKTVDRIARWILPTMLVAACSAAVLALAEGLGGNEAVSRALAVLVVTCPCALSLAIPLAVARTAAAARRLGAILRDPAVIEQARGLSTVLLDKTGTLTAGRPVIQQVVPQPGVSADAVLNMAAQAEQHSAHPLAKAICEAARQALPQRGGQHVECAGGGVIYQPADAPEIVVGSGAFLESRGIVLPPAAGGESTHVWVAEGQVLMGRIDLRDALRPGAAEALARLQEMGFATGILSGDRAAVVDALADSLGTESLSGMTPSDKNELIARRQARGVRVVFVGDGLNDGPALAAADVGIAVSSATELARSASAVGLIRGGVERLPALLCLLALANRVLTQNLVWAVAYNAVLIPVAVLGGIDPLWAALAMAASTLSILLNSLRIRLMGDQGSVIAEQGIN
ncbi:MAG: copper-translocating P-type ATPase [Xanthomonadales bacterium]|nr:copper-translocating P-type ATPase [Xanthomonadales bacterium]